MKAELSSITLKDDILTVVIHAPTGQKYKSIDARAWKAATEYITRNKLSRNWEELDWDDERDNTHDRMYYRILRYKNKDASSAQPEQMTRELYESKKRAAFDARPEVIALRKWIATLDPSDEDRFNNNLEMVQNALNQFVNTGRASINPLIMGAFVEMGVMTDKPQAANILDVFESVCERL